MQSATKISPSSLFTTFFMFYRGFYYADFYRLYHNATKNLENIGILLLLFDILLSFKSFGSETIVCVFVGWFICSLMRVRRSPQYSRVT
jgi:hypothetical protein